jgi:hypothetical protein
MKPDDLRTFPPKFGRQIRDKRVQTSFSPSPKMRCPDAAVAEPPLLGVAQERTEL